MAAARLETFTRWALPLGVLVFFAATAAGYGVFRDELYYFACARHLDWGYVWVARDPRVALADVWPATKHFD